MSLSISTWNLLSTNRSQYKALQFLLKQNIDIACLQELTPASVQYLKTLSGYHFDYGIDHYAKAHPFFGGILSRFPATESKKIAFTTKTSTTSLICRFFDWDEGKYFLYNDFVIGGKKLRVFNLHLTFGAGPAYRSKQLTEVCQYLLKDGENVLTGDFNSFIQFPYSYLIGPLFALSPGDYRASELRDLMEFIKKQGLRPCMEGVVTQPFFRVHIDHIFLPEHWSEVRCHLERQRHGSDHRMVIARTNHV